MKFIYSMVIMLTGLTMLASSSIGKVSSIEGRAFLKKENMGFKKIKLNDAIYQGNIIKTSKNAKVKITFLDDTQVYIAPKSKFKVEKYEYSKQKKERNSVLTMFSGKMKLLVAKIASKKKNFQVKTETATVGVRGTSFIVSIENPGESEVLVLSGSVAVENPLDITKKLVVLSKDDFIKSIGKLPVPDATKASNEDMKRLNKSLNIKANMQLKLDYQRLFKKIDLKKLLKKSKIKFKELNKKELKNQSETKSRKREINHNRERNNTYKKGYLKPSSIKVKFEADLGGK